MGKEVIKDKTNSVILCSCRVEEFVGIVPRQPWIAENTTGEVRLEFEAVQLDISRESGSRIWIHVRTMACTGQHQCRQVGGGVTSGITIYVAGGVWGHLEREKKEEHNRSDF